MLTILTKIWLIINRNLTGPLLITGFVILVNSPYLGNFYSANPTNTWSGLTNNIKPGSIPGGYTIDPNEGYSSQALGHLVAEEALHGHIPWWNPYEGLGAPLIGGMQAGALLPLQLLLELPNGLLYFHICLEIIAGISTYYFLTRLKCNQTAALIGGMAFAANGTFSWLHNAIFNPIAFLPLLLLGIEVAVEHTRNKKKSGWLLIALALALSLYAGFPETSFIDTVFASLWAFIRLFSLQKSQYGMYFRKLACGGTIGLALAAPILVAFVDYLHTTYLGLHTASTSHLILPYIGLSSLILPYIYGPIFAFSGYDHSSSYLFGWWSGAGGYLSITLIPLAIVGLLYKKVFRKESIFLALWIIFCVFASFGILGINLLAGNMPFLSKSVFSRYLPPTYELAAIILAAKGITYAWKGKGKFYIKLIGLAGLIVATLIVGAYFIGITEHHRLAGAPYEKTWFYLSFCWAILAGCGILVGLVAVRKKIGRFLVLALILADISAAYIIPMLSAPHQASIDLKPVIFLRKNLGEQRFYSLGPIQPNYGSYFKVASININDFPQKSYANYIVTKLNSNTDPITFTGANSINPDKTQPAKAFLQNTSNYELAGVKYVITAPGLFSLSEVQRTHLRLVFKDETSEIYQLPETTSYISAAGCMIKSFTRTAIQTNCAKPSLLIRREQFDPGWTVTIDGAQTPIHEASDLFQAVSIPRGNHQLRFNYLPPHMFDAYIITAITLACLVGARWLPFRSIATYSRGILSRR